MHLLPLQNPLSVLDPSGEPVTGTSSILSKKFGTPSMSLNFDRFWLVGRNVRMESNFVVPLPILQFSHKFLKMSVVALLPFSHYSVTFAE